MYVLYMYVYIVYSIIETENKLIVCHVIVIGDDMNIWSYYRNFVLVSVFKMILR